MFDKKYDFATTEKEMQDLWEKEQIFKYKKDPEKEVYSIDTPPPTVSGSLHIGHIFSYTQAEMIARFRRMQGYNVFYPFGFDDNGLPTERLVEKEEGIVARNLPRTDFAEKCIATTEKYENAFKELWKSLGFSCDWSLAYQTVSKDVQKISQYSFLELVKMGKAYAKESPVLWCTECQTSVAQAELDTKDVESNFVHIPFMVDGFPLEVATTRPELLFGVVCVFVNPDDERYEKFVGKKAKVPLYDFEVPILTDEKVALDKGTGVVMCATFGDATDVEWWEKYNLPYKKVVLPDGRLAEDVPFVAGLKVKAARKQIIELLQEKGLLLKIEPLVHAVGVHERCGTEVEIIPSRQWYIDVLTDKQKFLDAAKQIKWYPEYMKTRYDLWVENLKWDWCISRQRYFGVPIPVWYCAKCGKAHFPNLEDLPVNPLEVPYNGTCECGSTDFVPEDAVFDTWATSSITPQINARWTMEDDMSKELLPMSMRTQAHEIIRTWAFYTIVKSLYHTGTIPWKEIMICGFVLAKKGEKISKSKNNSEFAPPVLIKTHSADALRYWAANASLGLDTFFDADELSIAKKFVNKLWNASKFAISHLADFNPSEKVELLPVDKWIMESVRQTVKTASDNLYKYEIGAARHEIDDLFWKNFCDYYLEIVKERLYQPEVHGAEQRKSAQFALYYVLLNILKLYAVYTPHITDFIYQKYFRQFEKAVSIHLLSWEKVDSVDEKIIAFGEEMKTAVANMRKFKSENNLAMNAEIETMEIVCSEEFEDWFRLSEKDMIACSKAKNIVYS